MPNINYEDLSIITVLHVAHLLLLFRFAGQWLSICSSLQPFIHRSISCLCSSFDLCRPLSFLREVLYLTTNPKSKKAKQRYSKAKEENRLNTERATSFSNLNGTVVKCTLVWMLIYLIDNGAHKIKCSSLQKFVDGKYIWKSSLCWGRNWSIVKNLQNANIRVSN